MTATMIAGSRDSALALAQTRHVIAALQTRYPELQFDLKTYKTQGDIILDSPLSQVGGKGLFVKELETALLASEIDFAVHSMKDMPAEQPEGLALIPFGPRETPLDVLVSKSGMSFQSLPPGAVIGTSSLRRQAVLKHARPELQFQIVRGNVLTRLKKLDEGPFDALVLALAGLRRLNLEDRITEIFTPDAMLPACCQGTLGVEYRPDNPVAELLTPFVVPEVNICTQAERGFLCTVQGGCQVPMAAYATPAGNNTYRLRGLIADPAGTQVITEEALFLPDDAWHAGCDLAQHLLAQGGAAILANIHHIMVNMES